MTSYLLTHWQPVAVLVLGPLMLGFYYYLHLKKKQSVLPWIARNIFRNENMIPSAESLFNVLSSFLFMFGLIWVIVAIFYLANG